MARSYYTPFSTTVTEGDSFHAHTAKTCLIDSLKACEEEARYDAPIIYPAPPTLSGSGYQLAFGPHPLPWYFDRDGVLRRIYVQPLVSKGTASPSLDWHAFVTDGYREPDTSEDPSASWQVTDNVPTYQTATELSLPRSWTCRSPYSYDEGASGERVQIPMGWLTLYVDSPASYAPACCGVRVYDTVQD